MIREYPDREGAGVALIKEELDTLFYQHARITLWLGAAFFPFFSLLDYFLVPQFLGLFFSWRIAFSVLSLVLLHFLPRPWFRERVRKIVFGYLLIGAFVITQMTIKLGGFTSSYYVGILLIIVGSFSVLPLRALESMLLGGAMYLTYAGCTLLALWPLDASAVAAMVSNSFFFFSLIVLITIQCYDEIVLHWKTLLAQKNLQTINQQLKKYTCNLELLIEQRVAQLEESSLKFRELYDNIHDLAVLIDSQGTIRMLNRHGAKMLGLPQACLPGRSLGDFIRPGGQAALDAMILSPLQRGEKLTNRQIQLRTGDCRSLEAEVSGSAVQLSGSEREYQLLIRDISATKEVERQVLRSSQLLDDSRQSAIFGLARLAECRDEDTGAHLMRLRDYTRILASEMALMPEFSGIIDAAYIEDLCTSSILHDIGKIGIPDAILLKPGKLTPEEFGIVQKHSEYGYNALVSAEKDVSGLPFLRMGQEITRHHHEQWCGAGYPCGLAGEDIPLSARIVTLADVYDALTSVRTYKAAFPHEQARMLIIDDIGRRFDPRVGAAFLKREADFIAVNQAAAERA